MFVKFKRIASINMLIYMRSAYKDDHILKITNTFVSQHSSHKSIPIYSGIGCEARRDGKGPRKFMIGYQLDANPL